MNRTWMGRAVFGAALTALLMALLVAPASGHDVLGGSDPADGASVSSSPDRVTLTFNEAPEPTGAVLTVVGPGGTRWEKGPPTAEGSRLSVALNPLGPVGRYEVGYRVLSSDEHPITGSISFTLTTAGPGTVNGAATASAPAAAAAPPPASTQGPSSDVQQAQPAPASSEQSTGGLPAWPFVVLALVVIAGAVAFVLRRNAS